MLEETTNNKVDSDDRTVKLSKSLSLPERAIRLATNRKTYERKGTQMRVKQKKVIAATQLLE